MDSKRNLVEPSQFSQVDPGISPKVKLKRIETLELGGNSTVKSKKIRNIELNVIEHDSLPTDSGQNDQGHARSTRTEGVDEHEEIPKAKLNQNKPREQMIRALEALDGQDDAMARATAAQMKALN